jgi:DNA-binding SARP family transcriptional activator
MSSTTGPPSSLQVTSARAQLQHALDEHALRVATVRGLLIALEEQHIRLNTQLNAALRLFADPMTPADSPLDAEAEGPAVPVRVAVRCLGSLRLEVGGAVVDNWRSGKARALFEYLVTHRERPVGRDALIEALWPDPEAIASATSLKVAAHALRQIIVEASRALSPPPLAIVGHESSYQLAGSDIWVDVEEFDRCCSVASHLEAQDRSTDALALYARAADLYGGDFLADSWDEWVIFRREGLKDQYLTVLARLADAAFAAADYARCIQLCQAILEQDDCREDTFRTLMLCHARLGQRGRVRRWFQVCVRTLRNALDVEPEPETVRLYEWATSGEGRLTAR